ncbi:MAG: hypothetical protein K6U10_14030 [Acidobacteriia bacterium]|nr:hypothetical protein [Methyloceanibacter sp.]MCL6492920.1 hypothetical protein [Terriglobia bacterium]
MTERPPIPANTHKNSGPKPASAEEIRRIVGDVDDRVIRAIMETGATAAQVLEAALWFRGGGGLEDEPGHEPHGVVRAVYEILEAEEPAEPDA